ncbi:MAG: TIM barrel protein [Candidatus Peribacteraceae bacterium]|nr:TIM barrel protein [Candidatus Peribacteraceae bacterium]
MLHFAVAGSPLSTPLPGGTLEGLQRAKELGIDAMEIEWVQQVPSGTERMKEIREMARELDMALTVHAPYYVNLNSPEKPKLEASKQRILKALSQAELAGAVSVCVHAAFNLKLPPAKVYDNVRRSVAEIMEQKEKLFPHVNLALETMGKPSQFGTLEEALKISKEFGIYPCVDFAHIHARFQGKFNSTEEWNALLDQYEAALGRGSLKTMHIHYSGIAYGSSGERKHLPFSESDAQWKDFLSVLKKRKVGGVLVCESPIQEEDTLLLKKMYDQL